MARLTCRNAGTAWAEDAPAGWIVGVCRGLSSAVLVAAVVAGALGLGSCSSGMRSPVGGPGTGAEDQHSGEELRPDRIITIEGRLEDSETDRPSVGEVRLYGKHADGTYVQVGWEEVEADGEFAFSFEDDYDALDLQARLKRGFTYVSYVRTVPLSRESRSGLVVRAVPYTGLNGGTVETRVTIDQFRDFMIEAVDGGEGLAPWHPDHPIGIEVLHEFTPRQENVPWAPGTFTRMELDRIEAILKWDEVRILFGDRDVQLQIGDSSKPVSNRHYSLWRETMLVDEGWIVVSPSEYSGFPAGFAQGRRRTADGYRAGGAVVLRTPTSALTNDDLISLVLHEIGHVVFASFGSYTHSHSPSLTAAQSIMGVATHPSGGTKCLTPCMADRKAIAIVFEETFSPGTEVDEILGQRWRGD